MRKEIKNTVNVSQIMVDPVSVLRAEQTVLDAIREFRQYKIPIIPVTSQKGEFLGGVSWYQVMDSIDCNLSLSTKLSSIVTSDKLLIVQADANIDLDISFDGYEMICVCENKCLKGIIDLDNILKYYRWKNSILSGFEDLCKDYETILNNCYDSIFVTDGQGKILWFNTPTEKMSETPAKFLGKSVNFMETKSIFFPSVARLVLNDKKTRTIIQHSSNDKNMVVTGSPVFDDNGNIIKVVTISRDLDKLLADIKDFVETPELDSLHERLMDVNHKSERVFSELKQLRKDSFFNKQLVGCVSREMKAVLKQVDSISSVDTTVLLLGESGVGKDMLATTIHRQSERHDGPFIKINCGAIPEHLLESELFGYEAGAFTGASNKRKLGLFEIANGGTVYLDEIADMPINLQVKLLHVLQERSFLRVGGAKAVSIDVRIIAATNKDIIAMVKEGKFREDLFYRLNVVPIVVPPLRKRREDVPGLILHFLDTFNKKYQRNKRLSAEVMKVLINYKWPGNIRELENLLERLVVIGNNDIIQLYELPQNIYCNNDKKLIDYLINSNENLSLNDAVKKFELELIYDAYDKYKSTVKVAEILGVSRSTITRKLQKEDNGYNSITY